MSGVRQDFVRRPDRPWWVIAGSLRRARTNAILYSVTSVLFGLVALAPQLLGAAGQRWPIVLCAAWALLAAWGWAGVAYFERLRHRR